MDKEVVERSMSEAQRRRIDTAMLESLSTSFKMKAAGYPFMHSFNDTDVSELLERAAKIVAPRPLSASPLSQGWQADG